MKQFITIFAACSIAAAVVNAQQPTAPADPLVKENATVKVSDHVYVIPDGSVGLVPNVGIIVGSKATLVVDTGLGLRNGQTVARETAKVSRNAELYVVSTHFHPEHALGEAAFTSTATIVRFQNQQKDIDEFGLTLANTFASRTPMNAELLKGAAFRKADVLFDREKDLDLGGVRVRIFGLGPTHTRGDTMIFVEGDNVLFAGDVVMNKRFVSFSSPYSSVQAWLASLDFLAPLKPARVVPSHGPMGDGTLIEAQRASMAGIQSRARELKAQGKSSDETIQTVGAEFRAKYPDWLQPNAAGDAARVAYAEQK